MPMLSFHSPGTRPSPSCETKIHAQRQGSSASMAGEPSQPTRQSSLREGYPVFSRLSGTQTGNAPGHGDGGPGAKVHGKYLELLSSKTVSIYLYGLNAAFQQAVNERLFPYNPFKGVRPSKINRADATERRAFTVEEAQRLTEILPGEWPDMIRVCLYTGGQRLGDIATLQWKQIDMEGGIISMTTQKPRDT